MCGIAGLVHLDGGPADPLAGMFAFAVHDAALDELVLVRDRYGMKPLYWTREAGTLLFASEMKALLRHRRRNEIDLQSLSEWWLYRNVDALTPESLVDGVAQLLPGHLARIRGGEVEIAPWYSVHDQVDAEEYGRLAALSPEAIVDEVEARLDELVRLRLVSDVPVGTLLSGGLDSSLITAMAARHTAALTAFHVSVAGRADMDERGFAETLARDHRIPFVPMELAASQFRAALAHVTWLEDLPLTHANSVAYHLIGRTARQHGVTVLLSGEGADELFGGYAWNYRRRMRLARLQPWLNRLPGALHNVLKLLVCGRAVAVEQAPQPRA